MNGKGPRRLTKKKANGSPIFKAVGVVWYAGVLTLACGAGIVGNMMSRSSFVTKIIKDPTKLLNADYKATFGRQDGLTLLLLGCDEARVETGKFDSKGHSISRVVEKNARADMILVARLDFANKTISGLSIPRDTGCRLPGYKTNKINAYYRMAPKGEKTQLMQTAVEHILPGVAIDRAVVIDYDAFQDLVNVVGGVAVTVPKQMDYDDDSGQLHIHLKPGPQKLNGYDSMGYVRFRHDRDSDYGRQKRQKEFLASFKNAVISDPWSLPEVAEQGKVVLGNALSDDEIIALVAFSRKVAPTSIKLGMLPTTERRGSTTLRVDEDKREEAMREYGLLGSNRPAAVARR